MENAPPEKRRRRPPLACIACRRRKVRCDRKLPCQNCVRSRRTASCSYVSDERIEPREGTEGFEDGINGRHPQRDALSSVPFSTTTASPSNSSAEQLAERVKQLEQQLGQFVNAQNGSAAAQPDVPKAYSNKANFDPPTASKFLGPEHWRIQGSGTTDTGLPRARYSREVQGPGREREGPNSEEEHCMGGNVNAILSKSRYLGNSHWIHGVTLVSPFNLFNPPHSPSDRGVLPLVYPGARQAHSPTCLRICIACVPSDYSRDFSLVQTLQHHVQRWASDHSTVSTAYVVP